ncbi:hypothetical protein ACTFIV_010154 [Dictyostelium citrinum]
MKDYSKLKKPNFKDQYSSSGQCYFRASILAYDSEGIEKIEWIQQENINLFPEQPDSNNGTAVSSSYYIRGNVGDIIFSINVTSKNPSSSRVLPQKIICYDSPKNLIFVPISNYSFNFFKSTYSLYVNITGLEDNTDLPWLSTFNDYEFQVYLSFEFNKYKLTFVGVPDDISPVWTFYNEDKTAQFDIPSPKKNSISYQSMKFRYYEPNDYQMISLYDYPQYWFTFKPIERYPYINVMETLFKPKLVSSNDDGTYNYFINLNSIFAGLNFDLRYQNYSTLTKIEKSYNENYSIFELSNITVNETLLNNNKLFKINGIGLNSINRNEIIFTWERYQWNTLSFEGFPFGFGSGGNNNGPIMDISVLTNLNLPYQGYKLSIGDRGDTLTFNGTNTTLTDPTIIEYNVQDYLFNLKRVYLKYSTQFGISSIILSNYGYNYEMYGIYSYYSTDFNLLSGDLKNGELEFFYQYDIMDDGFFEIMVIDANSLYTNVMLAYPDSLLNNFGFSTESISNITFLFNDVNLTDSYGYNIMYLETNDDVPLSFDPCLQIIPQWDNITIIGEWINSRYEFKFFMPPNIVPGDFEYALKTPGFHMILNTELPDEFQLNVISDHIDLMGPIVTEINKNPSSNAVALISNENYNISWSFTITDYNGFDNGYVVVIGSIDNILYNFTIISPTQYSNEFTYQIDITLNNNTCISQTYSIAEMVLYDKYGLNSTFFMNKAIDYTPNINPLYQIQDKSLFSIETVCPNAIGSFIQPELKSFDFEPKSIDVGSLNRDVIFTYGISIGSGIKEYPIVYLTTTNLQKIKCNDVITTQNNSTFNEYKCKLTIPYGFGIPQDIMVNLYGLIGFGNYFGFSSATLRTMGYPFLIETSFTSFDSQSAGFITSTSSISTEGGSLLIYGKFPINGDISIEFSKGYSLTPSKKSGSIIKVDGVKPSSDPFTISIKNGISKSNLYTVTPYKTEYFRPILTSKCKGTPICGGPTQGTCNDVLGCICNSPWVGVDCSSKVIIVPQPVFNNTSPSIVINGTTSDNSESSIVALISVVAIREIDFNNKVVHRYSFDNWEYISNNSKLSTYSSNIINKNGSTTPISVNIEYFENEKTIEFAGQEINMKPSSIKYTINIDQYPFSTRLNQLQLILSATAITNSDSDSCSNKEFDNTTSESSDYIKLSISNKSLYGRLIKRALVDSKPITISNELLDQSLGAIDDSHTSQSFIGINIPIYSKKVIIDPDFSLLLNSNPTTSNDNENSICSPKSSSTGLSKAQLAGIIVGCSVAAIAITVATVVTIFKNKDLAKQKKIFTAKLKTMS